MSENKVRRKTFLMSLGAVALGWMGLRAGAGSSASHGEPAGSPSREKERVRREPRAVPCTGRTL
ncbi:MAG: hypothetical protein ACP5I4_03545 [Oceanipulchritudo sp.]